MYNIGDYIHTYVCTYMPSVLKPVYVWPISRRNRHSVVGTHAPEESSSSEECQLRVELLYQITGELLREILCVCTSLDDLLHLLKELV